MEKMFDPKNIHEIKDYFINNGYVILSPLVSKNELYNIENIIDKKMGKSAIGSSSSFLTNDLILKIPEIIPLIFKSKYLKVLKNLLNTDTLEIQHSKYNAKNLTGGSKVFVHQDFPYFPHTDDRILAFSFHLDGSYPENGGMFCYPKNWTSPLKHISTDDQDLHIHPENFKNHIKHNFVCPPGGISIHSCFLPHASNETQGLKRRIAIYQIRHPMNKQIGGALWKCSGLNPETMKYNTYSYSFNGETYLGRRMWEPKEYFTS